MANTNSGEVARKAALADEEGSTGLYKSIGMTDEQILRVFSVYEDNLEAQKQLKEMKLNG